jgi:hypothetical protein
MTGTTNEVEGCMCNEGYTMKPYIGTDKLDHEGEDVCVLDCTTDWFVNPDRNTCLTCTEAGHEEHNGWCYESSMMLSECLSIDNCNSCGTNELDVNNIWM